jgi:hypothetical protein
MTMMQKTFPAYSFRGTHRRIGQQFGEACANQIRKHLDYALMQLESQVIVPSAQALEEAALRYQPFVLDYAPFFDEEIRGIAEGAGISLRHIFSSLERKCINTLIRKIMNAPLLPCCRKLRLMARH